MVGTWSMVETWRILAHRLLKHFIDHISESIKPLKIAMYSRLRFNLMTFVWYRFQEYKFNSHKLFLILLWEDSKEFYPFSHVVAKNICAREHLVLMKFVDSYDWVSMMPRSVTYSDNTLSANLDSTGCTLFTVACTPMMAQINDHSVPFISHSFIPVSNLLTS